MIDTRKQLHAFFPGGLEEDEQACHLLFAGAVNRERIEMVTRPQANHAILPS